MQQVVSRRVGLRAFRPAARPLAAPAHVAVQRWNSHVVRAKTESVDLPIGEPAPYFEVCCVTQRGLFCVLRDRSCAAPAMPPRWALHIKVDSAGQHQEYPGDQPVLNWGVTCVHRDLLLLQLPDTVNGKTVKLTDFKGSPATFIMVICNHCPYVVHLKGALSLVASSMGSVNA